MFVSSDVLQESKISEFHDIAFLFWFVDLDIGNALEQILTW